MNVNSKFIIGLLLKIFLLVTLLTTIVVVGYWAIQPNNSPSWTGFGAYDENLNGPRAKTLWDWFELLIIPIFLATGIWWLNKTQKDNEKEIETDRQYQATLDTYFDCMTDLLLKQDQQNTNKKILSIARIRTLIVLSGIDRNRKAQVLQFLCEAGLVGKNPDIPLVGADFQDANLDGAKLVNVEIRGTYLNNCTIRDATFRNSDLRGTVFSGADLSRATIDDVDFSGSLFNKAKLKNVDLSTANLDLVDFSEADLRGAKISENQLANVVGLEKAILPDGKWYESWINLKHIKMRFFS